MINLRQLASKKGEKSLPPIRENERNTEKSLKKIYSDIKSSPSYSSKITAFLRNYETSNIHKRILKHKFPRRKFYVAHPFQIFQADLIQYTNKGYPHVNNGFRYILLVIDCFTKMIYAKPLRKKDKFCTSTAFANIFDDFDEYPNSIITDDGKVNTIKDHNFLFKFVGVLQFIGTKCFQPIWNTTLFDS